MKTVLVKIRLDDNDYDIAQAYIGYMKRKYNPRYTIDDYVEMLLNMYFAEMRRDDDE